MRFTASLRSLTRRAFPALVVALLALPASGALWLEGPQSTFETAGPVAADQLKLFYYTLILATILFVLTGTALAIATFKFRARTEADEHAAPPPQSHGNPMVELGLTIGSIICLLFIAVPTLRSIKYTYDVPGGETPAKLAKLVEEGKAYRIKSTAYQWWFKFEYPTEKTATGTDLVTANELVIPAGIPVHIDLRTGDVIHSFWVPKLGGKTDMIPNRANHVWLEADKPGYYFGQCAEYCGDSHSIMKFRVVALAKDDFAKWLAAQKQPARAAAPIAATPAAAGTMAVLKDLSNRDPFVPLA
ncbi:MAG: cytochrome c oxidase subunit II, partial [Verrucomicrobiota bacterium]